MSGATSWLGKDYDAKTKDVNYISIDMGTGGDTVGLYLTGAEYDSPSVSVDGGSGDDVIYGSHFGDSLYGGGGEDEIYGGGGGDYIDGGDDDDHLEGGDDGDWVYGRAGNDVLYGNDGADSLHAGAGNDTIYGYESATWADGYVDDIVGQEGFDTGYGELMDNFSTIESENT